MLETPNKRTIYNAVDEIKCAARAVRREWALGVLRELEIHNAQDLQAIVHGLLRERDNRRECLRTPKQTLFCGAGDIEDCAVVAVCLAEALELAYEMRIKGGSLFLFVNGVEVLHKP